MIHVHVYIGEDQDLVVDEDLEELGDYGDYKQYGFERNGEWIEIRIPTGLPEKF